MFESEPKVKVGILSADEIAFELYGDFSTDGRIVTGVQRVTTIAPGQFSWNGRTFSKLTFEPLDPKNTFRLKEVVIGVNFHWERKEDQVFTGDLTFLFEKGTLCAVNHVGVEDYLASVISSEMSASASSALLQAHAVISRSWLLAQMLHSKKSSTEIDDRVHSDNEIINWYDHDDHVNFDVCADDHCQRYQGVTRQTSPKVAEAIQATRGLVLTFEGELCDARFSKCCGGVFEEFENCWQPVHISYLEARRDAQNPENFPDLTIESEADAWINSEPDAFCNTHDAQILSQVLNNFDQETTNFYRWTVSYSRAQISNLIRRRSDIDFGEIKAITPVLRGTSGRIVKLKIEGTRLSLTVGKELEIRRWFSESHLYSSAFTVEYGPADESGLPASFTLHGAGWGHGVGLCQIGAAVMGEKGYDFRQILAHYFKNSQLTQIYRSNQQ